MTSRTPQKRLAERPSGEETKHKHPRLDGPRDMDVTLHLASKISQMSTQCVQLMGGPLPVTIDVPPSTASEPAPASAPAPMPAPASALPTVPIPAPTCEDVELTFKVNIAVVIKTLAKFEVSSVSAELVAECEDLLQTSLKILNACVRPPSVNVVNRAWEFQRQLTALALNQAKRATAAYRKQLVQIVTQGQELLAQLDRTQAPEKLPSKIWQMHVHNVMTTQQMLLKLLPPAAPRSTASNSSGASSGTSRVT